MMSKKILLVGGGGHCKSVIDSLLELNQYKKIGIIEKKNISINIMGIPTIGSDEDLAELFLQGYKYAFVTVGSIGKSNVRIKLFNVLNEIGFTIPNIIDSSAVVSSHINIETGIFIGKNAVINTGSSIYKGAIINTGAIIEHDCSIGAFVHIASGSVLSGEVRVGENTHIGANCVIKQQVQIGFDSIIGMGSVVLKDIQNNIIAYGNPCRKVKININND